MYINLPPIMKGGSCSMYTNKHKSRDKVIIIHNLTLLNQNVFLLVNIGIGMINETIWYTYVHSFSVISCVEAFKLIHMHVECMESFHPYIQRLVVESNSCALTVFIQERRFVVISCCVPHISPFLVRNIWYK